MSKKPFHELTPAEQERLACLAEECAEVIQIVNKIWRHGYESTHPDDSDGDTNRDMLERELGHVSHWIDRLGAAEDISFAGVVKGSEEKKASCQVYLHHQ